MALPHTDPTDLTGFSFVGGKSHRCSPPVCSKGSHGFNRFNKKIFVRFVGFVGFVVWD